MTATVTFQVVFGDNPGRIIQAQAPCLEFGRGRGPGHLNDSRVSLRHALVTWAEGRWVIRDVGSKAGTYVNDEMVLQPKALAVGDEVRMGRVLMLVDSVTTAPAAADTRPAQRRQAAGGGADRAPLYPPRPGVLPPSRQLPAPTQPTAAATPRLAMVARWRDEDTQLVRQEILTATGNELIGRDVGRLQLDDSQVSRCHARVWPLPTCWIIEDVNSSGGTLVNNQLLEGPRPLSRGDRLQIGRVRLVVKDARTAAQIQPVPEAPSPPPAEPAEAGDECIDGVGRGAVKPTGPLVDSAGSHRPEAPARPTQSPSPREDMLETRPPAMPSDDEGRSRSRLDDAAAVAANRRRRREAGSGPDSPSSAADPPQADRSPSPDPPTTPVTALVHRSASDLLNSRDPLLQNFGSIFPHMHGAPAADARAARDRRAPARSPKKAPARPDRTRRSLLWRWLVGWWL